MFDESGEMRGKPPTPSIPNRIEERMFDDGLVADEEDDFICGTHRLSLHLHECEGFDF